MKLLVVSPNAAMTMGGEAVKTLQYVKVLLGQGHDVLLITHERCREALAEELPEDRVIFVRDSFLMRLCWLLPGLGRLINSLFHLAVRRICRTFPPDKVVIQYLCPISPVEQRFPPRGHAYVIGPLSGNIFYPPGFHHLERPLTRLRQRAYGPLQRLLGLCSSQYRRASRVLVSGYGRTETALVWAGCPPEKMLRVRDAGLAEALFACPRMSPSASGDSFVWIGRMIPYKGADLAIRALAALPGSARLTLFGDRPERPRLEALVRDLDLRDRVRFAGWLPHRDLAAELSRHRALVFSSLREANGIVMQEAMAIGLPVLTLRWGGPLGLAAEGEALFVDVESEGQVIADLGAAMARLLAEPDLAEALSAAARARAEAEFRWEQVAQSWSRAAFAAAPVPRTSPAKRALGG